MNNEPRSFIKSLTRRLTCDEPQRAIGLLMERHRPKEPEQSVLVDSYQGLVIFDSGELVIHVRVYIGEEEETTTVVQLLHSRRLIDKIGIRASSYRELGCISDMSNSDELRHTDNTTLIPPRLPDTLPHVYHRRRPTLGLLILPSVLPFPPTIRRTARMSVLPIEPNLAERARISAINLDDYQLDPLTPPPSPSSPFSMAAYQRHRLQNNKK
ncbi:hypothetical protein Tco_1093236 [Tanacetum coccineum]|uniref:Uncharacterized protein n=1 Tax=Tanacetum coccineum TaxID=301880 RepID=A0ABQ5IEB2_9ASTR